MSEEDSTESQSPPVLRPAENNGDASPLVSMNSSDLAALESALAVRTRDLADTLLHNAMVEMEAALFERVSIELRSQLPQLIHQILSEHIAAEDD